MKWTFFCEAHHEPVWRHKADHVFLAFAQRPPMASSGKEFSLWTALTRSQRWLASARYHEKRTVRFQKGVTGVLRISLLVVPLSLVRFLINQPHLLPQSKLYYLFISRNTTALSVSFPQRFRFGFLFTALSLSVVAFYKKNATFPLRFSSWAEIQGSGLRGWC